MCTPDVRDLLLRLRSLHASGSHDQPDKAALQPHLLRRMHFRVVRALWRSPHLLVPTLACANSKHHQSMNILGRVLLPHGPLQALGT